MMLALLSGCAWINIPAQGGDYGADHDPNDERVLRIELQALRAVDEPLGPDAAVFVILPKDTLPASYEAVVPQVSAKAAWSAKPPATGALVLEVRQVRVRGTFAQADVIQPANAAEPEGLKQVVTVYLHRDIVVGWHVERLRPWHIGVEEALVQSEREAEINIKP